MRDSAKTSIEISIIVPLYNEEESIDPLYEAILNVVESLNTSYEIIFVDDGSKDSTFERARKLAAANPRLRAVKFRKNYGQTPAITAGIELARGDILITMDGDLQNDPLDIPRLIDKIKEGSDIVIGWRYKRKDKLITRKIPSKIANWIIGKVTGVPIKDNGCSLKAYRAKVIQNIPLYSEMHRFIPAMASITGAKITEIKVRHHPRKFGSSKYGLSRIYKVILDLIAIKTLISFSYRPLHWFALLASIPAIVSFLVFIFTAYSLITEPGKSIVVPLGVSLLFGVLAIFLIFSGMLCDLIYKTGNLKMKQLSKTTMGIDFLHQFYHSEKRLA